MHTYAYAWSDPLSGIDPKGLSVFKIIKLCKDGYKVIRTVSFKEAVRAIRKGEDVVAPSRSKANQAADAAGGGAQKPTRDRAHQPGHMPHYHPNPRTGSHVFYNAAAALTVSNYVQCTDCISADLASVADFFNPLSAPKDILDLINNDGD